MITVNFGVGRGHGGIGAAWHTRESGIRESSWQYTSLYCLGLAWFRMSQQKPNIKEWIHIYHPHILMTCNSQSSKFIFLIALIATIGKEMDGWHNGQRIEWGWSSLKWRGVIKYTLEPLIPGNMPISDCRRAEQGIALQVSEERIRLEAVIENIIQEASILCINFRLIWSAYPWISTKFEQFPST